MPQLLLEFFCEEIPARMQIRAERDLERLLSENLFAAGIRLSGARTYAGPRRLAAVLDGLPNELAEQIEEKKGPRLGAPEAALQGFVKSAGLASLADAEIIEDKKGAFYLARMRRPGRPMRDVLAQIVPQIVNSFPWPKSMRWGDGDLTWVRPLHSILCAFDGQLVPFEIEGIASGLITRGHRFHAPQAIEARSFAQYRDGLEAARVLIDREARKAKIMGEARDVMAARGLEWVQDDGLLDEVAGLCEWPVPLIGEMDPAFLELPAEVIRLTMRTHQRYFALFDPKRGGLSPHFLAVANIEAKDGGAAIAAGNARVLSARLSDARFFWEADKARPLDSLLPKLDRIIFHEKLGSVGEKARRVETLALELAQQICPADTQLAQEAAKLAKADLVSETVGEFPELQGQVGGWLLLAQGGDARVAQAIADHYRPVGPSDQVPREPISICVALADKLDTLCGFFAIDERPTGSKDPYALRRAALGVVRIILENGIKIPVKSMLLHPLRFSRVHQNIAEQKRLETVAAKHNDATGKRLRELAVDATELDRRFRSNAAIKSDEIKAIEDLLGFLFDRLKVQLREQGQRHDVIEAVFALGGDDLLECAERVAALSDFLAIPEGANLLAGYRRAANILSAEIKKSAKLEQELQGEIAPDRFVQDQERALHGAILAAEEAIPAALGGKAAYAQALLALSALRGPVDAFLEGVLVNDGDEAVRLNRLRALARVRALMGRVADFGKLEG